MFWEHSPEKRAHRLAQLLEALELQIEEAVEGRARFIGEILCDLQFITKLELRDVLESMDNGTAEDG